MKVRELQTLLSAEALSQPEEDREVCSGYTCDLLSWVMAHGAEGMAWVTVQTHMNVVAVAVLSDMACIVLPEGVRMEGEALQKAKDEGMAVLTTALTAYEICGRLAAQGIPGRA